MHQLLFLTGLAKMAFGIGVGAVGVLLASRLLKRMLGLHGLVAGDDANTATAAGIVWAGAFLALAILARHSVIATFAAIDFISQADPPVPGMLVQLALYALGHAVLSLAVGAAALLLGVWVFTSMTRDVDELREIREGKLAPAVVLATVVVVLALLTAPGLETALSGLIPFPVLPSDVAFPPS
jgi:uncharacterized membrane protein YjfL (UPF0719 family)